MGWPVSTASPRAFRNGTLQLDKSLARLMPRPARRLTPSSSTRRDSAHDATDMQQRDAARPYFDAARLRTPPTPHDDWHRAARRGATPHDLRLRTARLAPSSSRLLPLPLPLPFPSKKRKGKGGSELSGFWVSSGHGAASCMSACTRRCFGYRDLLESAALPMQSPTVEQSRQLTVS